MGTSFLIAIIIVVIAAVCGLAKASYEHNTSKRAPKGFKKWIGFIIEVAIIIALGIIALNLFFEPQPKSRWDSLSDEEQEWYEDNYGDGKMDDINDAIDDYNN